MVFAFRGKRIGVWSKPPCGYVHPEVAANFEATVKSLESLGAHVEPIELPFAETITDVFEKHWFCGAAARLAAAPKDKHHLIDADFLTIAARGAAFSAPDFIAAQMARGEFGMAMDKLLDVYDFVVAPGTAIPALEAGELVPVGSGLADWHLWAGFTFPINLSTQPAAVVPSGQTGDGLPISLQIIGARGADAQVLGAASAFETAFPEFFI